MFRKSVTLSLQEEINFLKKKGKFAISLSNPSFENKTIKNFNLENFNIQKSLSGEKKLIKLAKKNLLKQWIINKSNQNDIIITNGAKAGLYCVFKVIANRQKKNNFGIVNPNWPTYIDLIKISGGSPVFFNTKIENEYEIHLPTLEKFIKKNKLRILVISNPNNPSGKIHSQQAINKIINMCEKNKCYLILDESFSSHVFSKKLFLKKSQYKSKYLIIINSFSKNYHLQGLRLGVVLANKKLIEEFSNLHTAINGAPNNVSQNLIIKNNKRLLQTRDIKNKMKLVTDFLFSKGVDFYKPEGSFYIFPKILNKKRFKTLTKKYGLFYIGGENFGSKIYKDHYRFCFEKNKNELKKIIQIMSKNKIY